MKKLLIIIVIIVVAFVMVTNLSPGEENYPQVDRVASIPAGVVKITPETDQYPPVLHSNEFEKPIPMPGLINTAGAEDAAFVPYNSNEFYFVFVADVGVPPHIQIREKANGIWRSELSDGKWSEPERVWLEKADKVSLDGCQYVKDDKMWFCSVREGYGEPSWFVAERKNGKWTNWKNVAEELKQVEYNVGEFHITADGKELYFDSARTDGKGGHDIWVMRNVNGYWQEPENVEAVNTAGNEGRPYITEDGKELWFNRALGGPALYRSKKINGEWQEPELIISSFAGEPTLDSEGNVYFVHHFYKDGTMIEADIYVAYRAQ